MAGWKELVVWQKSHQLVLKIYDIVTSFPTDEKFALTDQIKRASYSIPSNIVEGHSKNTYKDFLKYLYISRGSLEELRYFIFLAKDLKYITINQFNEIENDTIEVSKMLNSFIISIKNRNENES